MSDRWQQIEHLYHSALECESGERAAFLDEACSGDESLREEVESLLACREEAENFIETPIVEVAAEALASDQRNLVEGQLIGRYRVLSLLGVGGMGEVYLGEDTHLKRRVALKMLRPEFTGDEDRVRRFEQEARAASALNHPNIITIHEIGYAADSHYIVTEHIEGELLRDHMCRGRLSLTAVLDVARQVASALEAAHAAGVVHRDIKPENVMLRSDGLVKVLDFGLAKLAALAAASETESTQPHVRTRTGILMGTVAYMSPEQARGQSVDHRTDIFSLGVVLYEMLTGQHPFKGESGVDILHGIIHQQPLPAVKLNPQLPAEASEILSKALAKDLSERYRHAGDFELDLRRLRRAVELNSTANASAGRSAGQQALRPTWRARLFWATVAAAVIGAFVLAVWLGLSPTQPRVVPLGQLMLTPFTTDPGYEGEPTFSPDGETIAYVSDRTGNFDIFLKQVSGGPDINLTANPADDVQPAFSPDGGQIAFVSSRSGKSDIFYPGYDLPPTGGDIWVMPKLGGASRRIADRGNYPSWSPDGSAILYASGPQFAQKIYRVAAHGGEPREVPLEFKRGAKTPRFLLHPSYSSDERWIVFEADTSVIGSRDVYVVRAEGGEAEHIAIGESPVWSADSRAVLYSNGEPGKNYSLWQIPFSTPQGRVSGLPEPLTVGRGRDSHPTLSRDGRQIAFAAVEISANAETLAFDAEAGRYLDKPDAITSGVGVTYLQTVSSDCKAVVFEARQGVGSHLWRADQSRAPVQLTADPDYVDTHPRWSPDDRMIAFNRRPANEPLDSTSLWLMAEDGGKPRLLSDGAGFFTWLMDGSGLIYLSLRDSQLYFIDQNTRSARRLTDEPNIVGPMTTSPDGQWVVFQSNRAGSIDLFTAPIAGGPARLVVATPKHDQHPFVSPSGRWLYFSSNHKNLWRVPGAAQNWRQEQPEKVTNFPEGGLFLEDAQISRDGRCLLYSRVRITGDIWIMRFGNEVHSQH